MSEMVERVARAMHAKSVEEVKLQMAREGFIQIPLDMAYMFKSWEDTTEISRQSMLSQARAALSAMRKPTPDMVLAALHVHPKSLKLGSCIVSAKYAAMIDAALSEKSNG